MARHVAIVTTEQRGFETGFRSHARVQRGWKKHLGIDAGFVEIQVAFMTIGDNAPWTWSAWNEELYQENWNLICSCIVRMA